MSNTPFPDIPFNDREGYVHIHPETGRKYRLSERADLGGSTVNVWSSVSDVRNRTWVSAEDPKTRIEQLGSETEPRAGDIWWDTHQMELRVLHHPVIGEMTEDGDKTPIYGEKQWVSSTHPSANMISLEGADKNNMFGNVIITTDRDGTLVSGEIVKYEAEMPYYTGPDPLYSREKVANEGDDPVPFPDKRYTLTWSVVPEYNATEAQLNAMTEAEKELHKNKLEIPDEEYENQITVSAGEIASGFGTPLLVVNCIVKAKPKYNDLFIPQSGTEEDGSPKLHTSVGKSAPNSLIKRQERNVIVNILPATTQLSELIEKDSKSADFNPSDDREVRYMITDNIIEVDDIEGSTAKLTLLNKNSECGDWGVLEADNPDDLAQMPGPSYITDPSEFSKVNIYFSYGKDGETYDLSKFGSTVSHDVSEYTGKTAAELRDEYTLTFWKKGFSNTTPPANPDDPYTTPYTDNGSGDLVDYTDESGAIHKCIKLSIVRDATDLMEGIGYVVTNGSGQRIHEMHGRFAESFIGFEAPEDDENTDDTDSTTTEPTGGGY